MTPAQLQTIEEIFRAALDQEPDQAGPFLDTACKGDELLRREVEALLASHQQAGSFIETPAAGLAARIIENGQADLLVGQAIGHYKISKRIGAGGMGEVYLATDITAGRKAALKLLPMRFTGDTERLKRFQQEARAVVALNHPNILTVYEIGEDHSTHYIASELIEGETLRERLMRGRMQLSEAVNVAIQVARALAAAHEAGIVHRDIKPENIMLRPDGYVKVLDFGIAKLAEQEVPVTMAEEEAVLLVETHLGSILGTVRYMSPEQARGAPVDQGTDIWSLGVVLYEMVAGHAPFPGDTPREVMNSILATEPSPLTSSIAQPPAELQQIISNTLRKDRRERYQSTHELLEALQSLRRRMEFKTELERSTTTPSSRRWTRSPTAAVIALFAAALALALPYYWHRNLARSSIPEKSIAVLPFENFSTEKENAFFAEGVQDEILSDLAKIADLKVISRTSANLYKSGSPRNTREIAQQLGVAHIVEGSVQRAGNRVRVNAQLIDTRTDSHLWAQTYDREVVNVFAIQSEIARTIADQLGAKIAERENAAIAQPATSDLVASDLYTQALALESQLPEHPSLLKAVGLLEEAVTRDLRFYLAYCALGRMHLTFHSHGYDHTDARLAMAKAAIEKAAQIQPDAGEVHLLRARYLGLALRDYDQARAELELARRSLPNNSAVYLETAMIDRRQGRLTEAGMNFDRAIELDPRNTALLIEAASTFSGMHRYDKATELARRAVGVSPLDHDARILASELPLSQRADIRPLKEELTAMLTDEPGIAEGFADQLLYCAIFDRDAAAADRALAAIPPEGLATFATLVVPREYFVGSVARTFNRPDIARPAFETARTALEKMVREQPDHAEAWALLGRAEAALGKKEEAIRAGRHACELLPMSKEFGSGVRLVRQLAGIYAWVGEKELAIQQIAILAGQDFGIDYGELKLDPQWDPLRGEPRFEKIVASLAPRAASP